MRSARLGIRERDVRIYPGRLRIHPRPLRIHPRRFRIYPRAFRIHPQRFRMHPQARRIYPQARRIYPRLFRIDPPAFRRHPQAPGRRLEAFRRPLRRTRRGLPPPRSSLQGAGASGILVQRMSSPSRRSTNATTLPSSRRKIRRLRGLPATKGGLGRESRERLGREGLPLSLLLHGWYGTSLGRGGLLLLRVRIVSRALFFGFLVRVT